MSRSWPFVCFLLLVVAAVHAEGPVSIWEVWKDPGLVARAPSGVRTVLSSSYCPEGCEFDRHSQEQSRFIRTLGEEGVIFETEGAGAITRIWMTQGQGKSQDIDALIRLKISIDGDDEPVVDRAAGDLFDGDSAPFLSPMVLDRTSSGGGFVSLVPIPFRKGCRVSLVGAAEAKIWYQVTAVLVDGQQPVVSFSPDTDLGVWQSMLENPGEDPWPRRAWPTISGSTRLASGKIQRLAVLEGPDQITGLILRAPRGRWPEVELRLTFDGQRTVVMPLSWFFGVSGHQCLRMRSLFIGAYEGDLYSYFPMPFFERAVVEVRLTPQATKPLELEYAVRREGRAPSADAGIFRAQVIDIPASKPGTEALLMDLSGRGRVAGIAVTAGLAEGEGWAFLEGDETVVVDGETSWRGTGVEDFFSGGFYFRGDDKKPKLFRRALHGLTCIGGSKTRPSMSLYRLLPTDGPFFNRSLEFRQEGGPTGDHPVRWRGVFLSYLRPSTADEGIEKFLPAP